RMVRLGIRGSTADERLRVARQQLDGEGPRDPVRDLGLNGKAVFVSPLVAVGPELRLSAHFNQLSGDADAAGLEPDATFEHEVDEGPVRPEALAEIIARHDFAGALEQQRENLKRLFLQTQPQPLPAQLA